MGNIGSKKKQQQKTTSKMGKMRSSQSTTQTECVYPVSHVKTNKHLICDDAYTNRLVLKKYLLLLVVKLMKLKMVLML